MKSVWFCQMLFYYVLFWWCLRLGNPKPMRQKSFYLTSDVFLELAVRLFVRILVLRFVDFCIIYGIFIISEGYET